MAMCFTSDEVLIASDVRSRETAWPAMFKYL
jgi:hypothetical protein